MRAGSRSFSPRGAAALALFVAASTSGCDWRDFDQLKGETPVLAIGPPGGFASTDDFGRHVLALSGPPSGASGGRFIVSASRRAEIAIMDVDGAGHVSGRAAIPPVFGSGDMTLPITSMAEIPGTNKLLLGAPQAGTGGSVYVFSMGASPTATLLDSPAAQERFGLGVAVGALAGGPEPDYVVLSGFNLSVYLDGDPARAVVAPDPPATCPLEIPMGLQSRDRQNRAVLVEDVTGAGSPQIIVGTPLFAAGDAGAVSVFTVDAMTGAASCAFTYRGSTPRFGHALAVGDFDGDKKLDLLIGAPPLGAFWIRGPLTPTSPILPVALGAASETTERGFSVAAVDLDADGRAEALVSDIDALVDGKLQAGEVRVAGGAQLDVQRTTLRRASPGENDGFGAEVRALPFCSSGCGTATPTTRKIPLVGAAHQTYALFKVAPGDMDPRKP
jgi:hypothetical protein